jgi:uncharacterized protein YmfQ (DUF2313 family)
MAMRFAATMNAFNRGIEDTKPKAAIGLIEDWEAALAELDMPGAKGIARDLEALKKQLDKGEPDEERIDALLHRLGQATVKIAERAEKNQDKIRALGEALTNAGTEQADEEEDMTAAANPRARQRQKKAA